MIKNDHWRRHFGALYLYIICALILIDHGVSVTKNISGRGSDPFDSTWFLAWWPWAICHHVNPFFTRLAWYPVGLSLSWVTSVPILAMIGWPVTAFAGPVVTYNLYMILAPVLSAWGAYFLCFRLTSDVEAALIGGFLFGFSSYEMAQETGALNLSFTCALPALILAALARLDGRIDRRVSICVLAALLVFQFLICIEIFAFVVVFGGIALVLAMWFFADDRQKIREFFVDSAWAGVLTVLVVSPFLVSMWYNVGLINHPAIWPYYFTSDLANFLIPSRTNLIGALIPDLSAHFNLSLQEQDAYIGLPLIFIIWRFSRDHDACQQRRFLLALFFVYLIASLGPRLWLDGQYLPIILPWSIFVHVPLLSAALPARFALFVSLVTAIIAALWIAAAPSGGKRLAVGILACISFLPNWHPWMKVPFSEFFRPSQVNKILGTNSHVLILPFGPNGPSSYWQQESHFRIIQTGGYLGFPPAPMQRFPIVRNLFTNNVVADFDNELETFCQQTGTQYVLVGQGTSTSIAAAMAKTGWTHRLVDDVILYTVPIVHG